MRRCLTDCSCFTSDTHFSRVDSFSFVIDCVTVIHLPLAQTGVFVAHVAALGLLLLV